MSDTHPLSTSVVRCIAACVATVAALVSQPGAHAGQIAHTYDALGRLKSSTLVDGTVITYEYDATGNRYTTTIDTATPTGIAWPILRENGPFTATPVGAPAASKTLEFANGGTGPMTITGLGGIDAPFTLVVNTCTNIAPGASCELRVNLSAAAAGQFGQYVQVQGTPITTEFPLAGAIYPATGSVAVAASTIGSWTDSAMPCLDGRCYIDGGWNLTLTNAGNAPMTLANEYVDAGGILGTAVRWGNTSYCTGVAAAGECMMYVAPEASPGRWRFLAWTSGATTNAPEDVFLVSRGGVTSDLPGVDFGTVAPGAPRPQQVFTLTNLTAAAATIATPPTNPLLPYSWVANTCTAVAPGTTCAMTLEAQTDQAGTYLGEFELAGPGYYLPLTANMTVGPVAPTAAAAAAAPQRHVRARCSSGSQGKPVCVPVQPATAARRVK